METPDEPLAAARAFTDALNSMAAELAAVKDSQAQQDTQLEQREAGERRLRRYGRRNRLFIAFDIALTIGFAFVSLQACEARDSASQTHSYQVSNCLATNKSRDDAAHLWNTMIALAVASSRRPESPQARSFITQFQAEVNRTYAHRDCSKI